MRAQQQSSSNQTPMQIQVPSIQAQQQPPVEPTATPPPLLSKTPVAQAPPSPQPQSSRPPSRPRTSESERPKTPQSSNVNGSSAETRITVSVPPDLERPLTGNGGLGASIMTNPPPMASPPLAPSNDASVAELHGRVEALANHVATLFAVCPGLQQSHSRPRSQGGRPVSQGRGSSPSGGGNNTASAASVCLSCNQPMLPNQQHPQCSPMPGGGGGGYGGNNYMSGPVPGSVVNARAAAGVSGALGGVTLGGGFHLDRPQPSGGAASPFAPIAASPAANAGGGNSGALPIGAGLGNAPPDNHRMRGGATTMATSSHHQQQQHSAYGGYPQSGPGGVSSEGGLPPLVPHAKDTMGVMGADGRLYRSDVAKGGAPPRRTKPSRDASPDGQTSAKFPPPR